MRFQSIQNQHLNTLLSILACLEPIKYLRFFLAGETIPLKHCFFTIIKHNFCWKTNMFFMVSVKNIVKHMLSCEQHMLLYK